MNKYFLLALCFAATLFWSCAPQYVRFGISSIQDPHKTIFTDDSIVVLPLDTTTDIQSRYYAEKVKHELTRSGVGKIFDAGAISKKNIPIKYMVFVSTGTNASTYQYSQPEFGLVGNGQVTTECGYTIYGTVACNSKEGRRKEVTGYHQETGYALEKWVKIDFFDGKAIILESRANTFDDKCSDDFYFNFLIEELARKMFIGKPQNYTDSIEYPHDWNCEKEMRFDD